MASPDRQNSPKTDLTTQEVLNESFDKAYRLLTVHAAKLDPVTGAMIADSAAGSDEHTEDQVSVSNTATEIIGARLNRRGVVIINNGNVDVFLGGSSVTTASGLLLLGVKGAAITIETTAAIYGIVASGTNTVSFMELF